MLIILEGADGSGKSTLACEIADHLRTTHPADMIDVWHAGPPKSGEHPLDLYERPLWKYLPNAGHHIICDRHHVGEWIYPSVFGRETLADTAVWRHIDLFLQSRGAVFVHANPPIQQIIENVQARGDDLVSVPQLQGIVTAYNAMMHATYIPRFRHTQLGNPFVPGEVIRLARYYESRASVLNQFVTYVGPPKPKYLLLGDVRHDLREYARYQVIPELTRAHGPAFGPYRNTSGHFLLTHLPGDIMPQLGLANACDVDDVAQLWEALGKPQTVTLGKNASSMVKFPHFTTDHPQYVRRFHNATGPAYGRSIMEGFSDE